MHLLDHLAAGGGDDDTGRRGRADGGADRRGVEVAGDVEVAALAQVLEADS